MTYETLKLNIEPLHEGNVQDLLHIEVGENLPLDQCGDITVVVRNTGSRAVILSGKKSTGKVIITGQFIRVPLEPENTIGNAGDYEYELDIKNLEEKPFLTIRGKGTITPQSNNL